jgi:hypothetical protein
MPRRALAKLLERIGPEESPDAIAPRLEARLAEANFRVCETRSFGRDYRVAYVLDRLRYLYPRLESGAISRAAFAMARRFAEQTVHINAGDVMALAAVRV